MKIMEDKYLVANNQTNPLNTTSSDDQSSEVDSQLSRDQSPPLMKDPKAYIQEKVREIFEEQHKILEVARNEVDSA